MVTKWLPGRLRACSDGSLKGLIFFFNQEAEASLRENKQIAPVFPSIPSLGLYSLASSL